jgi:hypothetical protein
MAAEHWFRWHHGCVTDPKFRVIASRCVTFVTVGHVVAVWAAMMENASLASPRGQLSGWDDEDVAVCFGFDTAQVTAIREAMQGKVLHGNELSSWEKRQPKREDSSSERNKSWRERKRSEQDANERSVTQCDATQRAVTLETETETDKKDQKITPSVEYFTGVPEQVVRDFKQLRQKLRAPITATAMDGIRREADKAGLSLTNALTLCCERGWRGFKAEWVSGSGFTPTTPPTSSPPRRKKLGEGSSTNYGDPA